MNLIYRLACFIILLSAPVSYAATVTYDFSGSIIGAHHRLSPSISRSDSFFGSFSIAGTDESSRHHSDIINGFINIAGLEYEFTDHDLLLIDSYHSDLYGIFDSSLEDGALTGPSIAGRAVSALQFIFADWRGADGGYSGSPDGVNGLTSSQLLQLSLFDTNRVVLNFGHRIAFGQIDSLVATPVPAAAWLFFAGLVGLFGRQIIRGKRSHG